nr:hypothetical protein [Martelella limonii]
MSEARILNGGASESGNLPRTPRPYPRRGNCLAQQPVDLTKGRPAIDKTEHDVRAPARNRAGSADFPFSEDDLVETFERLFVSVIAMMVVRKGIVSFRQVRCKSLFKNSPQAPICVLRTPLVMFASWRMVARSPLGTPSTYWSIVSSSDTFPSSTSCKSAVTVNVLVTGPMRVCMPTSIGAPVSGPATPKAPV